MHLHPTICVEHLLCARGHHRTEKDIHTSTVLELTLRWGKGRNRTDIQNSLGVFENRTSSLFEDNFRRRINRMGCQVIEVVREGYPCRGDLELRPEG